MVEPRDLAKMTLDELASWGGNVAPGGPNDQALKTEFARRQTDAQIGAARSTAIAAWAAVGAALAGAIAAIAALMQARPGL